MLDDKIFELEAALEQLVSSLATSNESIEALQTDLMTANGNIETL